MKSNSSASNFWVAVAIAVVGLALSQLNFFADVFAQSNETGLSSVRRSDVSSKDAQGNVTRLSPAEHMRRAAVYMNNRAFAEARQHWETLIKFYPEDARVPEAMLGIGRSYFQAKDYAQEIGRAHV